VQEKLLSVKARPAISLGGVRDQAQICAYVTSSRGSVVQLLPVILLDEVDKTGQKVICMEILPLRSWKSWISNKIGALIMIIFIYLKFYSYTLPIFSTLYLRRYSIGVK